MSGINLGNIRDAYFFAKVGSPLEREVRRLEEELVEAQS